jgi:putative two-component system response regulator
MRVLIVDDSTTNLLIFTKVAQSIGCTTVAFSDPLAALEAFPASEADLAIIDYHMPSLNGLELIKQIRAFPACADVPLVMVTANSESSVRYAALDAGATDFLKRPIDPVEVKSRLRNLLKLRSAQNALRDRAAWLATEVAKATQSLADREQEIIFRLARAAEFRDSDTGAHLVRMAAYCRLIGEGLGSDAEECRILQLAAPMHDVGKIAVPDSILLKPGKLSPDERRVMEQHTLQGETILADSQCDLIRVAAVLAGSHHECWDGTGYPRGLKGDTIPLVGRIAAVADVFDALTTERPYKQAWSPEAARDYIRERAGSQFDPACVAAFLDRWPDVLALWETSRAADEAKSAA